MTPARIENFKPKLKKGTLTPQGPKVIFETKDPMDQIILPVDMSDFLVLCDGETSLREIISRLYRRHSSVHFKSLFRTICQLQEKGFLENSEDFPFEIEKKQKANWPRFLKQPLILFSLGQRLAHSQTHPFTFYLFSMFVIIGSILAFEQFPKDLFSRAFLSVDDSFLKGIGFFVVASSILLSLKNLYKSILLLTLTGRVYNCSLAFNGFAFYFRVGMDSVNLIGNRLYLSIFHLSVALCYFFFVSMIYWFWPTLPYHSSAMMIALILTIVELDPFRRSEMSDFFKALHEDDSLARLSDYLRNKTLLSIMDPEQRSKDQSLFVVFSHLALVWACGGLLLINALFRANWPYLEQAWSEGVFSAESLSLGVIYLVVGLLGLVMIYNLVQTVYLNVLDPLAKKVYSFLRLRQQVNVQNFSSEKVIETIRTLPLFSFFSNEELQDILQKSQVLAYPPKTRVIVQGDIGRDLFVLLDGVLSVQKRENVGWIRHVAQLRPVTIFGEVAVIEECRRTAEVAAVRLATVLKIPAEVLREKARESQYIQEIEKFKNAIMVNQFFSSAPLFRELPDEVAQLFTTNGDIIDCPEGKIVFRQGDHGDAFYMVVRGSVDIVINNVRVTSIRQGGFFGEISVIAGVPRTATVITSENSVFLKILADDFWGILSQNLEIAMFIESVGEMRMREDVEFLDTERIKMVR